VSELEWTLLLAIRFEGRRRNVAAVHYLEDSVWLSMMDFHSTMHFSIGGKGYGNRHVIIQDESVFAICLRLAVRRLWLCPTNLQQALSDKTHRPILLCVGYAEKGSIVRPRVSDAHSFGMRCRWRSRWTKVVVSANSTKSAPNITLQNSRWRARLLTTRVFLHNYEDSCLPPPPMFVVVGGDVRS
jgi:hypothetical protein